MTDRPYQFDDVSVDPRNFQVWKAGQPVVLEPKVFLLLVFLIENRERLVEKHEILDVIWKDIAVTENALTREVAKLRKALGEDAKSARYIQTVHTRGYRFIAKVETRDPGEEIRAEAYTPQVAPLPGRSRRLLHSPKLLGALGALIVLVSAGLFLKRNVAAANKSAVNARHTLAVLPFQSLGAGPNDRYVGLAITDTVITKLSGIPRLSVQPTSVILQYVDTRQDSLAIGRSLRVDYVLEGRFQSQSGRIRVTVQLLCISCDRASQWAASFDEMSEDLFHAEDSISEKVARALMLELDGDQYKRLRKQPTTQPEAQIAVAKGMTFLVRDTPESLHKAIELFEEAVRRDPDYAVAWAQLSDAYRRQEWYGTAPADVMAKVRTAALKSVALDDTLCYGHSMLGFVAYQYDWDFPAAEREYRRALQLNRGFVHQWYARYLLAFDRQAEAEDEYRRFLAKVPVSAAGRTNVAQFAILTAQYDRAAAVLRETFEMEPGYPPAHEMMGLVDQQQGREAEALAEFQKAVELSHRTAGLGSLGYLYGRMGRGADAGDVLREMTAESKHRYVAPFDVALVHAGRGENEQALESLEKAFADHSLSAQLLRFDPRLRAVRQQARYRQFVKRIGLPGQ